MKLRETKKFDSPSGMEMRDVIAALERRLASSHEVCRLENEKRLSLLYVISALEGLLASSGQTLALQERRGCVLFVLFVLLFVLCC